MTIYYSEFVLCLKVCANLRDVAQLGSALRSGRRGRWFESSHPDFCCTVNCQII